MMRIYTGGTMDLFHAGHVELLKDCARLGQVWVALNTDEFVTEFKGQPPVIPYAQRKAVLESCSHVYAVIENVGGADSKPAILRVTPNVIVIGSDWLGKDYYKQMGFTREWLDARGISLFYSSRDSGQSSTDIKAEIARRAAERTWGDAHARVRKVLMDPSS